MKKLHNEELNRISVEEFKKAKKTPFIIVLDNIRSFNNVGSAFRTADAFRLESIYLCGITAKPPHREIHKTALGATESMNWEYFSKTKDAIVKLKEMNFKIIGIEQMDDSVLLNSFKPEPHEKYALIFGNEVKGIDSNIISDCDMFIEIPQIGTKHSLNVSVSLGIVVWDLYSKRINLKLY